MPPADQTIAQLLATREAHALELAVMPAAKEGTPWARDRYAAIASINRQLTRLGVDPRSV